MILGIDQLLKDKQSLEFLSSKKVALACHAASVTRKGQYTLEALQKAGVNISLLLTPQHGFWALEQANMIETSSGHDEFFQLPFSSLYSSRRKLSDNDVSQFDVLLVDLQDVGCRVYTYLTTMIYCMQSCAEKGKSFWILDRPNPAGRFVEGSILKAGYESFVGVTCLPLRHGMTLAELALWYQKNHCSTLDLKVFKMEGYSPENEPWPLELTWMNPSPNMPQARSALFYSGTVILEGSTLSEGRGTTRPLETLGAPYWDIKQVIQSLSKMAPSLVQQFFLRPVRFRPTFDKFANQPCWGLELHENFEFQFHSQSFRLICMLLKACQQLYPKENLLLGPPYEYEEHLPPLDILTGSDFVRNWLVEKGDFKELDQHLRADEVQWIEQRQIHLLYK